MVSVLDQFWVALGLPREELKEERGRGLVYVLLGVTALGSLALATDLILNLSGRFG